MDIAAPVSPIAATISQYRAAKQCNESHEQLWSLLQYSRPQAAHWLTPVARRTNAKGDRIAVC